MRWIISKDGVVICVTSVPYPAWIIKDMKQYMDTRLKLWRSKR